MPYAARYTLTQLAGLADVTPRTVRYYITQGLLPSPGSVGPGPKYTDADLARLRTIKRLQREHQPLAEIRAQLAKLDDATVLRLAEAPEPPKESALDYIRRVSGAQHTAGAPASLLKRVESAHYAAKATPSMVPTAPAAPAPETPAEPRLERSQWERIELAPDVELHVRRPLARQMAKRVDRLVSIARDLLEEEPQ